MVSARLPVAPRPFRDELLSSWVARVAEHYGAEPLELMVYLAGQGGGDPGARQVDDVAPDMGLLRLWAKACRIDPARLRHRSLASRYPDLPQDWFLNETVPVCLACFDADVAAGRDAYLRADWRLAEQVVCPAHRTLLLDRCPACRGGLRLSFRMLNGLLRPFCRKCDAVLTGGGGETEDHLKADLAAGVLELQHQINGIVRGDSAVLIDSSVEFVPCGRRSIATGRPGRSSRSGTMNRVGAAPTRPARPSVGLRLSSTFQCVGGL